MRVDREGGEEGHDDGVNDAWYKSECGQACGFGGEKFKWLVRMVLLHPFIRLSNPILLFCSSATVTALYNLPFS